MRDAGIVDNANRVIDKDKILLKSGPKPKIEIDDKVSKLK
jgi:hypothetical protein